MFDLIHILVLLGMVSVAYTYKAQLNELLLLNKQSDVFQESNETKSENILSKPLPKLERVSSRDSLMTSEMISPFPRISSRHSSGRNISPFENIANARLRSNTMNNKKLSDLKESLTESSVSCSAFTS